MSYYYTCSYMLEPGSVVKPGNWGRNWGCRQLISADGKPLAESSVCVARELLFELERVKSFPQLPSRLTCAFVFDDLHAARTYLERYGKTLDLLYEVRLLDADAKTFRTCMLLYDLPARIRVQDALTHPRAYWNPNPNELQLPEILTESRLEIVRQI